MKKLINRYPYTAGFVIGLILLGMFSTIVIATPDRSMRGDNNLVTSSSTPAVKVHVPIDPTGVWESTTDEPKMIAMITKRTIAIDFVRDKTETNYWNGTFDEPQSGLSTISSRRVDESFMLSSAAFKTFIYNADTISFEVESMGSKTTVTLTRR